MYKKFIFIFAISLICFTQLKATDVLLEGQVGYFLPTSKKFRDIYGNGMVFGGLEVTAKLQWQMYIWGSTHYYYDKGKSIGLRDTTEVTMVPIGFGLKYLYPVNFVDLYLGIGALPTYVKFRDKSAYVIPKSDKWTLGGIAKMGAIFNINKHFFIDLFTNYSMVRTKFDDTNNNNRVERTSSTLDTWNIGLGLGYRFGKNS